MSFNQVYGAIQQGVVDGAENSEQTYMTNRHYEVAPYLSDTDHFITPNCIVVSTALFGGLPKELQDCWSRSGRIPGRLRAQDLGGSQGPSSRATMKAAGVKINEADKKAFRATVGRCTRSTRRRSRRIGGTP